MRKYFALVLAVLVFASLAIPYLAFAEVTAWTPDSSAVEALAEPPQAQAQPVVVYAAGADPPTPIDLTPLLQAILSLCASLITIYLLPWIRAKYSVEQRQRIAATYRTIVYAAEQMFGAGAGERKLQWAVNELEQRGFTVDRALLEEQVKRMGNLPNIIYEAEIASTGPPPT